MSGALPHGERGGAVADRDYNARFDGICNLL
jgi:hypothetical protein